MQNNEYQTAVHFVTEFSIFIQDCLLNLPTAWKHDLPNNFLRNEKCVCTENGENIQLGGVGVGLRKLRAWNEVNADCGLTVDRQVPW